MTQQEVDHASTLSGYKLWSVMKWAEKMGKRDVFDACYARAKSLNRHEYGRWEEAKSVFESLQFPFWGKETKTHVENTLGYFTEFYQEMNDKNEIKTKYMVLINQKTNSCVLRWFIRNGEVSFS